MWILNILYASQIMLDGEIHLKMDFCDMQIGTYLCFSLHI